MIVANKTYHDGRLFRYHKVGEPIVDLANGKLTVIMKSWEVEAEADANSRNHVYFATDIMFIEWDAELLEGIETTVLGTDWYPYKSTYLPPVVKTLEEVKADKIKAINEQRDLIEKQGFPYLEKVFDSNIIGSARLSMAIHAANSAMALDMPFSIDWTTADNTEITLDAEQMLYLPLVFANYANELHMHAKAKKLLVQAATTIAEVEAITW